MQTRFNMDGGKIHLSTDRSDERRRADAASPAISTFSRWPEQLYSVRSRIDFPTQKDIFFHGQNFTVPARRLRRHFPSVQGRRAS